MNLTEIQEGVLCEIVHIQLDQKAKQRLMYVGIYEGAKLCVERKSRKGKPMSIFVLGNMMMLRYQDCERIEVSIV